MLQKIRGHKEVIRNRTSKEDHSKRLHLRSMELRKMLENLEPDGSNEISLPKEMVHSILSEISTYSSDLTKSGCSTLSIIATNLHNTLLKDMHVETTNMENYAKISNMIFRISVDHLYYAACMLDDCARFTASL